MAPPKVDSHMDESTAKIVALCYMMAKADIFQLRTAELTEALGISQAKNV